MTTRTVMIPAYNEQNVIQTMLEAIWPQVDVLVVVEDGSTDDTRAQIAA